MTETKFNINTNEYLPLRDVVFNTLRDAILTGKLVPGERLMENQLAEKLGVSRTPVREALRMLELENLVELVPSDTAGFSGFGTSESAYRFLLPERSHHGNLRQYPQNDLHHFPQPRVQNPLPYFSAAANIPLSSSYKPERLQALPARF